jgi:hypothetical protein
MAPKRPKGKELLKERDLFKFYRFAGIQPEDLEEDEERRKPHSAANSPRPSPQINVRESIPGRPGMKRQKITVESKKTPSHGALGSPAFPSRAMLRSALLDRRRQVPSVRRRQQQAPSVRPTPPKK